MKKLEKFFKIWFLILSLLCFPFGIILGAYFSSIILFIIFEVVGSFFLALADTFLW